MVILLFYGNNCALMLGIYCALQSSLSENISYGSMNDLFALYTHYDTINEKECDILHETSLFKYFCLILCRAMVAKMTLHSVFSSGMDLVQYDLAILTEWSRKYFWGKTELPFFLC